MDVWGWAWFGRDGLASCCVTIDGRAVATADLEPAPPDVAALRPATTRAKRCGWRATIDLADWTEHDIVIGALATSERGVTQHLAASHVRVTTPRTRTVGAPLGWPGGIEQPVPGSEAHRGRLVLSGWALAGGEQLDRLEVRIDDRDAGCARPLAVPRPDVAARFADAAAPLAGFEHLVTIDGRLGQRVRIDADLVTIDGARRPLSGTTVVIGPSDEPALPRRTSNVVGSLRSNGNGRPQSSTPRLVVFTHDLRLGGAQLYLQELLRDLIKNSNAPCLVVAGQDGPLREELEMLGAAVHVTDFPLPDAKHYEARCVELAMLAQTFGATVALVNTLIAGIGMDAARLLDLPTVWAVHESYTLEDYWAITCGNGRGRALASTSRQALADASLVLFEADATRAAYRREVESDRLTTLYYGIDLEAVAQFIASTDPSEEREHLGLGSDETVLLCIGVFEPRKAQALLAAAFSRLADDHPTARLVMVGETESDYSRHVRQFVKRLGLKDRVRLEPLDANPYRWYRVADAFVVASDLESLPRVVLEAMAFEVPVVATSVWGIPELVREHETGILFPPRDVGALTQALKAMLNMDPLERQRLGRSASRLVHERHDLAAYRRTFNRVVSRLATDPDASPGTLLSA